MRCFPGDTFLASKFMSMLHNGMEHSRGKMIVVRGNYPYLQGLIKKRFKCIINYKSNIISGDEC